MSAIRPTSKRITNECRREIKGIMNSISTIRDDMLIKEVNWFDYRVELCPEGIKKLR